LAGDNEESSQDPTGAPKAQEQFVSLAQVLLAPLDALFQAQVHAGRSFLNFLLQLAYDDKPREREKTPPADAAAAPSRPDTIYSVKFVQEVPGPADTDGTPSRQLQEVSIPALALVPVRPLAIEEAEVNLAMEVTNIGKHEQFGPAKQADDGPPPPWWLVRDPISLRGHVANAAPVSSSDSLTQKRLVQIKVKVAPVATPAGLEKLLTTLTQSAQVKNV